MKDRGPQGKILGSPGCLPNVPDLASWPRGRCRIGAVISLLWLRTTPVIVVDLAFHLSNLNLTWLPYHSLPVIKW